MDSWSPSSVSRAFPDLATGLPQQPETYANHCDEEYLISAGCMLRLVLACAETGFYDRRWWRAVGQVSEGRWR